MRMFVHILVLGVALMTARNGLCPGTRAAGRHKPIKMVVLGDSLSAGLGLSGRRGVPRAACKNP